MRLFLLMLFGLILIPGSLSLAQTSETRADLQLVFSHLKDEATTEQAATELRRLASQDSGVREYISANLPSVIEKHPVGPVWKSAVELAGNLKITSAIKDLVADLGRNTKSGAITFASDRRLDDDPPGKALVEIGDPAVPALDRALGSDNKEVRWRVALVLCNINSPLARRVLRRHLGSESDVNLRTTIQDALK